MTASVTCMALSTTLAAVLTTAGLLGLCPLPAGASHVPNMLTAVFLAFVTWGIASGRGWVVWLMGIFYVLGSLLGALFFLQKPEILGLMTAGLIAAALTQLTLQTTALALLCPRASRAWFRRRDQYR